MIPVLIMFIIPQKKLNEKQDKANFFYELSLVYPYPKLVCYNKKGRHRSKIFEGYPVKPKTAKPKEGVQFQF